ncbi:hypothetical protein BC938DRAFT_472735 [Jimgerdemannia flammicorona]|uniref:Uncharacterized protein n=1 Tax=Jimgerdemannia flammicorona TaxID=994334 RepID=A0A433Q5H7_9FUNG|nr:hypothetical protein BC938DRAFT_472735 [Jimgerdemannia flammicorona]
MSLSINKEAKTLDINIAGIESLLAVQTSFSVLLSNIRLPVVPQPKEAQGWWHGVRIGTNIPGVYTSGKRLLSPHCSFYSVDGQRTRSFYHMRDPKRTILIPLKNEEFYQLIIEVDSAITPEAMAENIREAVEEVRWEEQKGRRSAEYADAVTA